MLFAGREVRTGKNCAQGLEYSPRPQAEGCAVLCNLDRQITCLFCLSGKLLYKKYLRWFVTEAVTHRACAFDVLVKQTCVVYRSI